MFFSVPLTNVCLLSWCRKKLVWSKRPAMLLVRRDVNMMHLTSLTKFFENLNSISNIPQEPHYLLIFIGSAAIYISLRNIQPKFPCKERRGSFFAVFYHPEDISCKVWVATWIDTTTNSFLWMSRFTTILSQCRGSPWYQV